jgi:alcohol dehydrogenase
VDDLLTLQGVDRITAKLLPFIAIPTTAGTGSEVTAVAVIYNEKTEAKMAFMSNKLFPDAAIIDPVMTLTLPAKITAATGMDALTHAVEAYYCLQKNPVSDAFSAAAIPMICENLPLAVNEPGNEAARLAMANAALLAGIAFSNSMVGIVHGLAHATGAVAHVPHGTANSILLPFGMEYNLAKVPEHLAELAPLLGETDLSGSIQEVAARAPNRVRDLTTKLHELCGLPVKLGDAGVERDQLERIARLSIDDGTVTYNPDDMTFEDALGVLKKAF